MEYKPFKKNIHKARNVRIELLNTWIETYDPRYKPPKYYFFMKTMLEHGYQVKLYQAGVSKYVFIIKNDIVYKIRFSNHRPIKEKELENDCDFYVGISHLQASKTEDIINKILFNDQQSTKCPE